MICWSYLALDRIGEYAFNFVIPFVVCMLITLRMSTVSLFVTGKPVQVFHCHLMACNSQEPGWFSLNSDWVQAGWSRLFFRTSIPALGPTQPHTERAPMFFAGVKRPRRDADRSLLSSTSIKNEWSNTPSPHICLRGVGKDNFNFTCDTVTDMKC